jgi:DNA-binding CsgD family transcriptional regulator
MAGQYQADPWNSSAFGLTPAEARLAGRLVDEDSVETAADELGVTYETARKTLKRVALLRLAGPRNLRMAPDRRDH